MGEIQYAIEHMTDFQTAHHAVLRQAREAPERNLLNQPYKKELRTHNCQQAADEALRMANALSAIGLEHGDKVAILAKNSAEWILADLAIAMAGMISVPIYPTAGVDTIAHVLEHSEARAVFVGVLDNRHVATEAIPESLITIAFPYDVADCQYKWLDLIDEHEPLAEVHSPEPDDVMSILYTSGSTGKPKGVVMSYGAYSFSSQVYAKTIDVSPDDRVLSYLPLAHVTERSCGAGPAIYSGASTYFTESLATFFTDLQRARPTLFISVPRLWVKFQAAVHEKMPPAKLNLLLSIPIVKGIVAKKIRENLGFGDCRGYGCGSAPISIVTLEWYSRLGIEITEGWGMSETTGLNLANFPFERDRLGTLGGPLEGTEIRLSDDGELLLRSPTLFSGYYKQDDLTAESFTEDGFLRTGDKAVFHEDSQAYQIVGRVKEIFKTAKGKYVAPVPIEGQLAANPLLEQVCVMGAGLPAPVAVIVLGEASRNLPREEVEPRVKATMSEVNRKLESHERLGHAIVAAEEWSTENGLLTPTLKLIREKLEDKYRDLVSQKHDTRVVWE